MVYCPIQHSDWFDAVLSHDICRLYCGICTLETSPGLAAGNRLGPGSQALGYRSTDDTAADHEIFTEIGRKGLMPYVT